MNPLFSAAAEVQDLCTEQHWKFCFIGGVATLRWGEPRLTRGVDLTIATGFGGEEPVIDGLLNRLWPRIEDARQFAMRHRVALLIAGNDVPVDVAFGALDFEERTVQRASPWDAGEVALLTCGPEDLIVHKVFAGRDRDWADIEGVVLRQGPLLDRALIFSEVGPLLEAKGTSTDLGRIHKLLETGS